MAAARIIGPKGLAGAMRLEVLTDRDDRLTVGATLFVEGEQAPRRIREVRAYHHGNRKNPSGDLLGFDHAGRGHTMLEAS